MTKLTGKAVVVPNQEEKSPDAYIRIGINGRVVTVGSKLYMQDLQELADALNEWAGKS